MKVCYRKCDQCKAERLHHLTLGWYRLAQYDADDFDFCSMACLGTWANSRAIGRFSVVRTTGFSAVSA